MSRSLYVLLEGTDDVMFFNRVLRPELSKKYRQIKVIRYAPEPKLKLEKIVKTLNHSSTEYIVFVDLNSAPCATKCKALLEGKIRGVRPERVAVVKQEIESWYAAGLDHPGTRNMGITFYSNTEKVSKEHLEDSMPTKFNSRVDFMQEILNSFDISTAMKRNDSFKYVWNKFVRGA